MTPTTDWGFHTLGAELMDLLHNVFYWDIQNTQGQQSNNNIDPNSNAQIHPDSSNPIPDSNSNQISSASSAGDVTAPGGLDVTGTTPPLPITPNEETSPTAAVPGNLDTISQPGSNVALNPISDYSNLLNDPLS